MSLVSVRAVSDGAFKDALAVDIQVEFSFLRREPSADFLEELGESKQLFGDSLKTFAFLQSLEPRIISFHVRETLPRF